MTIEEYNDIPVFYCTRCLSLNIQNIDEHTDYCAECGSTDIEETHINTWEKLKEESDKFKFELEY